MLQPALVSLMSRIPLVTLPLHLSTPLAVCTHATPQYTSLLRSVMCLSLIQSHSMQVYRCVNANVCSTRT
uniref:Secreted protein n=1 Tax=Anguilla anguilla TaxID=7936 RepID=A0A0E9PQ47_ANGAN